jgi:hypothetical protein
MEVRGWRLRLVASEVKRLGLEAGRCLEVWAWRLEAGG